MIYTKKVSLYKGTDSEYAASKTTNKRTGGMGQLPGKRRIFQQKKVSQTSSRAEILAETRQMIEAEQKWVERIKRSKNASVLGNKDNKDKRANIIAEKKLKRIVADLEHQLQHFKSKAYY